MYLTKQVGIWRYPQGCHAVMVLEIRKAACGPSESRITCWPNPASYMPLAPPGRPQVPQEHAAEPKSSFIVCLVASYHQAWLCRLSVVYSGGNCNCSCGWLNDATRAAAALGKLRAVCIYFASHSTPWHSPIISGTIGGRDSAAAELLSSRTTHTHAGCLWARCKVPVSPCQCVTGICPVQDYTPRV